jgi:hypothetical protein
MHVHNMSYPASYAVLKCDDLAMTKLFNAGAARCMMGRVHSVFNQSRDVRTKRCFAKVIN